ncbi:uncharacterized protein LOC144653414 [Oculina patagonica]
MMDSNEILFQTIRDNRHTLEYVKNLLACKELSVNFSNPHDQQTALHIAARRGDADLLKLLCSYGAYVNGGTVDLMTPLHEACLGGHPEVVDILIAEGADTNARNIDGSTPLCFACAKGSLKCTRLLVEAGAEINPTLTVTFPPLHEAALNGHVHCLEMLMQMGANLEKSENQFGTALHVACLQGYVECVRTLLHAGANPNVIKRHQAPLHTAALCGFEDCTSLLIEYGANVYQRNLESKRPADLATDTACRKILQTKAESPPRLLQSCRLVIRQQLPRPPADKIPFLPLPRSLKDYLNYYH